MYLKNKNKTTTLNEKKSEIVCKQMTNQKKKKRFKTRARTRISFCCR